LLHRKNFRAIFFVETDLRLSQSFGPFKPVESAFR
jgi:hypothetical protein